jgi:magnesium dechelatase
MGTLDPRRLRVAFAPGTSTDLLLLPRVYTLTHSDRTGDLFLTVGPEVDRRQISGWYTRLLRDEVTAEWVADGHPDQKRSCRLEVQCHVSGGFTVGSASWRWGILHQHMPLAIQALRYGDRLLFTVNPELDAAPVFVRFRSNRPQYAVTEAWGEIGDYRPG